MAKHESNEYEYRLYPRQGPRGGGKWVSERTPANRRHGHKMIEIRTRSDGARFSNSMTTMQRTSNGWACRGRSGTGQIRAWMKRHKVGKMFSRVKSTKVGGGGMLSREHNIKPARLTSKMNGQMVRAMAQRELWADRRRCQGHRV